MSLGPDYSATASRSLGNGGAMYDSTVEGTRAAGMVHGTRAAGMVHGTRAAGMVHGTRAAGNMLAGSIHSSVGDSMGGGHLASLSSTYPLAEMQRKNGGVQVHTRN